MFTEIGSALTMVKGGEIQLFNFRSCSETRSFKIKKETE